MDSVLEGINNYEGKTARELIEKSQNRDIWKLIKRGIRFDDEVLNVCRISKSVRDEKTFWEVVSRPQAKPSKTYKKDTANYEEIVESLSHVDVEEEQSANDDDEIEEFFEHDDDE